MSLIIKNLKLSSFVLIFIEFFKISQLISEFLTKITVDKIIDFFIITVNCFRPYINTQNQHIIKLYLILNFVVIIHTYFARINVLYHFLYIIQHKPHLVLIRDILQKQLLIAYIGRFIIY